MNRLQKISPAHVYNEGWYARTFRAAKMWARRTPLPDGVRKFLRRLAKLLPNPASGLPHPGVYAGSPDDPDYAAWVEQHTFNDDVAARLSRLRQRPLISVVMPVHDPDLDHLKLAIASVEAQFYPNWELCIADDVSKNPAISSFLADYAARSKRLRFGRLERSGQIAGTTNAAIALARGDFLAFLDHDDELTPDALLEIATLLHDNPDTDLIYSDHDILGIDGRRRFPSFKPDWSPELLLSYMYFGHLKVYRAALVRSVGGLRAGFEGSADYDLALRLVERTERIRHIPQILYHWRAAPSSMARTSETKPQSFEAGRRALEEALRRRGIEGVAEQPSFAERAKLGLYKIHFRSTKHIPVTIIIPTRDKIDLLRSCVESIEQKTTHISYEILIIDNESRDPETLNYFAQSCHQVISFENSGVFNFAAMMNLGVEQTQTEYFVLLNNDTLVINSEWLDELIGYGELPGVGAVGAKLLYPDGRIQHAGVILGTHGLTGHAFQPRRDADDQLEYQAYAHVARNYLAVTAACMLSRKTVFTEVGGFNDRDLKVAWNDVDYCLRLREKGYRVVFNPYATLYHLESQSRGDDKNPAEIRYMMSHWRHYIDGDPFYNPNLSLSDSEFRIKKDPQEDRLFYYREYR
jgi:GT2 family glycosyltransferase